MSKELKAAAAKEKYHNNKESEQRRKFVYRIKQGNVPNLTSKSKYGLTLAIHIGILFCFKNLVYLKI
jgi:hypothetical protein